MKLILKDGFPLQEFGSTVMRAIAIPAHQIDATKTGSCRSANSLAKKPRHSQDLEDAA